MVAVANDRCDQENIIAQLKSGVNALRVPLYDLLSNWAYMVIAALAWNIKSWFATMLHRKTDRREYIAMEFRRFLTGIILIPAMIIRRARAITVRLIGYNPAWTGRSAPGTPSNEPASAERQPVPSPHRPPHNRGGDHPCPHTQTTPRAPSPSCLTSNIEPSRATAHLLSTRIHTLNRPPT